MDGRYLFDGVPFSCCNPSSPRPCIQDRLTNNSAHYNYEHQTEELNIYIRGCREALVNYYMGLMNTIGAAVLSIFLVQVLCRYISIQKPKSEIMSFVAIRGSPEQTSVSGHNYTCSSLLSNTVCPSSCITFLPSPILPPQSSVLVSLRYLQTAMEAVAGQENTEIETEGYLLEKGVKETIMEYVTPVLVFLQLNEVGSEDAEAGETPAK